MIGFEYVISQPWAIREENLKTILEIVSRTNPSLQEVEASMGKKLQNKNESSIQDGVKVIDVIGPIVRYGNMFSDISGARSLSGLKNDVATALADEEVESILFNIDSPGGEASGINEFTEFLFEARGQKPMVSYVSNQACSAAYWIASATDKIVCDETASLGSIGCVAVLRNSEEKDAKEGIKNITFVSSNSKNKRPDINTEEGKSLIQEQIDSIGDIFISKVARNRSTESNQLSFNDVVKNFNKGGVLIGKQAVKAGLADELGSFESTLNNLKGIGVTDLNIDKETSLTEDKNMSTIKDEKDTSNVVANAEPIVKETVKIIDSSVDVEALKAENVKLSQQLGGVEEAMKALKAENVAIAQRALKVEADATAQSLKDKMLPAQVEGFIADYIRASNDDSALPVASGDTRVARLVATWDSMPSHNKTNETLKVLENVQDDEDADAKELAELDAVANDFVNKQNKTHLSN